jgi:hypothetical protein
MKMTQSHNKMLQHNNDWKLFHRTFGIVDREWLFFCSCSLHLGITKYLVTAELKILWLRLLGDSLLCCVSSVQAVSPIKCATQPWVFDREKLSHGLSLSGWGETIILWRSLWNNSVITYISWKLSYCAGWRISEADKMFLCLKWQSK